MIGEGGEVSFSVPLSAVIAGEEDFYARKRLLASDPLASVDGFRAIVLFTFKFVFGMRVCHRCPDCNLGTGDDGIWGCQDFFGSNAAPEGGIFGSSDAVYASIEAQKSSGALHAHCQLFLQCLHQHNPLQHLMALIQKKKPWLVGDYLKYKEHVARQVYSDLPGAKRTLSEVEAGWPEYSSKRLLLNRPAHLNNGQSLNTGNNRTQNAKVWLEDYLHDEVQQLQMYKQNHVHARDEETGKENH